MKKILVVIVLFLFSLLIACTDKEDTSVTYYVLNEKETIMLAEGEEIISYEEGYSYIAFFTSQGRLFLGYDNYEELSDGEVIQYQYPLDVTRKIIGDDDVITKVTFLREYIIVVVNHRQVLLVNPKVSLKNDLPIQVNLRLDLTNQIYNQNLDELEVIDISHHFNLSAEEGISQINVVRYPGNLDYVAEVLTSSGRIFYRYIRYLYKDFSNEENQFIEAEPLVSLSSGEKIIDIYTGQFISIYLSNHGKIYSRGISGRKGQIFNSGYEDKIKDITGLFNLEDDERIIDLKIQMEISGISYLLVLTSNGRLIVWGAAVPGDQINMSNFDNNPIDITSFISNEDKVERIFSGAPVVSPETGRIFYTFFVSIEDGDVFAWGSNLDGLLGVGETENENDPAEIHEITNISSELNLEDGEVIESISYVSYSILANTNFGNIINWGFNYFQIGAGQRILEPMVINESLYEDEVAVDFIVNGHNSTILLVTDNQNYHLENYFYNIKNIAKTYNYYEAYHSEVFTDYNYVPTPGVFDGWYTDPFLYNKFGGHDYPKNLYGIVRLSEYEKIREIMFSPDYYRLVDGELYELKEIDADYYRHDRDNFVTREVMKHNVDPDYVMKDWNPEEYYDNQLIVYEHVQGDELLVDEFLNSLFDDYGLFVYDYEDGELSNQVMATSFYEVWLPGDDANFDGLVDEEDEPYYGQYMTDEDGNYIYNNFIRSLISRYEKGKVIEINLMVTDSDGRSSSIQIIFEIV
ncbi:hypothetical protein HF295_07320 [Hujiaoplasma nucleasis]|uniref:Uncharacterized protein n=1 Tax=Hujiaoplasma nucleasis TaxID=2725268 RepID=A0A7L6N6P5_9MOLU|nr:hypothetical protein [Hujiaoplasma nucleasis]QLY40665.1 hypothetical protein HF295_07320 [Hujiaoplasma nucleasis]